MTGSTSGRGSAQRARGEGHLREYAGGALLRLSIVSHKGPAGYAAARQLVDDGRDPSVLRLPATGVGITGLVSAQIALPAAGPVRGIVFGFAAGVFLHVAMDVLPRCEIGTEVHELLSVSGDAHALFHRLRLHAVASTSVGGLVVLLAWLVITYAYPVRFEITDRNGAGYPGVSTATPR